jgi:5-amino-6-(5-phosphoribosylamino)uracil reductase
VEERPYVLLSCAVSLDGYLDDATADRLLLSNDADFDRVDEVRAGCDAILVGAGTIRADDPRLVVRSPHRRAARVARGLPATPLKVALSRSGDLDPGARFFSGDGEHLVHRGDPAQALADLAGRGVRRLLVEGGSRTFTAFLSAGLADELHLVVAPLFVGDSRAPRLVADGDFPWNKGDRARLVAAGAVGDVALLRFALSDRCPGV